MSLEKFFLLLHPYKNRIETKISEAASKWTFGTSLQDACLYALQNGGKRFRPAIVYLIAEALKKDFDVSPSALAVEYFHTASLIADDLPCMDDEKERRGRPCVHKVFGESTALLASYALIAEGYEQIRLNAFNPQLLSFAIESATKNTGFLGATGGQYLDLFPPSLDEASLRDVIQKKTAALFELSFVFGWIFGGGNLDLLAEVKKAAFHFGMAFQIVDDFDDCEKDLAEGRLINYPALLGKERAHQVLCFELQELETTIKKLRLQSPELEAMIDFLKEAAYSTSTNSFSSTPA